MCGLPTCNKLVAPAILATPEQFKEAVESEIDKEEKSLSILTRLKFYFYKDDREVWRQSKKKELLSEGIKYGPGTLLDYAVASGNLPVVKFLLDFGVDPNAISRYGDTLFHRCVFVPSVWKDGKRLESKDFSIEKRFEAMEVVLARGGDLQRLDQNRLSAIWVCKKEEIVDFYIRKIAEKK